MNVEKKCPPEHRHSGNSVCYIIHKCRCSECRDSQASRARTRARLKAYGRFDTGLVDITPVREHVEHLQAFGYGWKRIAALAGVGNTAVSQIIYGRKGSNSDPRKGEQLKRIKRDTAEKILAVRPEFDSLAGGVTVPARGTHRRVQALVALGWSQSEVARRIGMERGNFWAMMLRDTVSVATHRAVCAVFDELCMIVPPHGEWREKIVYNRSLAFAKAHRWLPPLAWDDIDNDPTPAVVDDEGGVDEIAVELALSGERVRLSPLERRAAVSRAHALRWSDAHTGQTIGCASETVARIRDELGLEAWPFEDLVKRGAA